MQTKQNIKPVSQQVQVISVLPQEIDKFWGLVEFLIAEALKYGGSYADLKDIKEELEKDRMQLFLAKREIELCDHGIPSGFSHCDA